MVPSRVSGGSKGLLILGTAARTNTPNYYNLNGVRGERLRVTPNATGFSEALNDTGSKF